MPALWSRKDRKTTRPNSRPVVKIFKSISGLKSADKGAVIALGNFDGIHRGHQAVINAARSAAEAQGKSLGLGLFSPHPTRYFKPDLPPFLLMSRRVRREVLDGLGVSVCYEIPFDDALRNMDDEEFVEEVLHQGLGIAHVVVGDDFGYGKKRCGNIETLQKHCAKRGIGVTPIKPIGLHKLYGKYGSTEIRDALKNGNVFHAAHMLSRPWQVDGIVSEGAKRGRTIGFPTANIPFGEFIRPKHGVYCIEVRLEAGADWLPAVANTGTRPTVEGEEARIEAHIFDFDQDIYGQHVDVRFRSFIRAEQKFESFDVLKEQIAKDAAGARAVFSI